jgi:hypothetical protein
VDLDELAPPDFDSRPAGPYDSKVAPIEVSIAVDSELGKRLEGDITEESLCDREDHESLSSCAPTILRMEMGRSEEGSESSTK